MAHNKLGITGPMEAPSRHFLLRPIFLLVVLVALFIGGGLIFSLSQNSARPVPQFPGGIPEADLKANLPIPTASTVTPTPTPTPAPIKKALFDAGVTLYLGTPSYGVGIEFDETGGQHPFPIVITRIMSGEIGMRDAETPRTVLATIPDPGLGQVGQEWEIIVTDPDRLNNLIKIKLVRVVRTAYEKMAQGYYDYEVFSSISGDGGKSWSTQPVAWPVWQKEIYEQQKRASSN